MTAPLAIINLGSTGNVGAAIEYFRDKKKVGKFLDGLHTGAAVGTSKQLAELLLANHHSRTSLGQHGSSNIRSGSKSQPGF